VSVIEITIEAELMIQADRVETGDDWPALAIQGPFVGGAQLQVADLKPFIISTSFRRGARRVMSQSQRRRPFRWRSAPARWLCRK
jgi:hypothetical protein